jgi:energy-coupling factor transporter ATP-binding protein EcfA2
MSKIADVVKLKTGYANFVELKSSFEESKENADRMSMYRPTKGHRAAFERLFRGLIQLNDKKFYLLSGSYGTGKSHLCLMFANFLSRSSGDPQVQGFYDNYAKLDAQKAKELRNVRKDGQYLVAICDYHSGRRFEDVVLKAIFEACKAQGLDADVESEFDEAERQLATWESMGNSGIRNFYEDFEKTLEKIAPGVPVAQLREGLKDYDSEFLEKFHLAYREVMGGREFQAEAGNLIPIVRKLIKSKSFKERFKGVAVLFDEFGYTLERHAYSKDVLHGFMETLCHAEPNVIFVGCIHKGFKDYADRTNQADASVMDARKTEVPLLNEGIEEIIGAIVEVDKTSDAWTAEVQPKIGVLDQFLPVCETLQLFPWIEDTQRIRQRVLEDIYGVHPMALSCLLSLSSNIGSNARSTFTFFSGDVGGEPGSYPEFIKNTDLTVNGGKLSLYTVDRLFSFFEKELSPKNVELRDTQRPLVNGYYASLDALRKDMEGELFEEEKDERIATLRTILIYQLCGIPTHADNICFGRYCMTKSEKKQVEAHLKVLSQCGAVFLRPQSKTYELAVGTGEDPVDLINRYMKDASLHPKDMVASFIEEGGDQKELEFLDAKQHNLHYSEDKRLKRYFYRAKDLGDDLWENLHREFESAQTKDKMAYEGVAVYALCEDESDVELAKSAAEAIPYDNTIVAVPHEPQPFADALLRVKACRHFLPPNDAEKISAQTESRLRDIFEDPDDGYLPALRRLLEAIVSGENARFYAKDGRVLVDQPKQPHKPADMLCVELFKKRCKIKHPDLNLAHDDKWRVGKNTALRQAVAVLLSESVFIDNGNPDNHGEKRYLQKVLLQGSNALRRTGTEGRVTYFECESEPSTISDDYPVLRELCQRMDILNPGETMPVGSFLAEVKKPPYGVGGTSLILALAHVVHAFGERLRVFSDSTLTVEQPLNTYDDLVEVVSDPAPKLVFEVRDITKKQRQLVDGIAVLVGATSLKHGETRSLKEAYEAVNTWWRELPPVSKVVELYPTKDRKRLANLKNIMGDIARVDRFDLLLNRIPALYLGESAEGTLSETDVETVCASFGADVKSFGNGYSLVQAEVAEGIASLFDTKGDLIHCESVMSEWFQNGLNPAQRDPMRYDDDPDAEALVKTLADGNSSFDSKVMATLPMAFGFEAIRYWDSLPIADYIAKLKQAKAAIEKQAVRIPDPVVGSVVNGQEIADNHWRMDGDSTVELCITEPATTLIYTTNGEDPRKSDSRHTHTGSLTLENPCGQHPGVKILVRAMDNDGNLSGLLDVRLTNKAHEYQITVRKDDLYIREAFFKYPESLDDLVTVIKSLLASSLKERLISKEQADSVRESLDKLQDG